MLGLLKSIFNKLVYLIDPKFDPYEELGHKNARVLAAFVICFAPMLLGFAIATYVILEHMPLVFWEAFSGLGMIFGVAVYRKKRNFVLSTNLMLSSGVCIIISASFYTGGVYSDLLFWSCVAPMAAGMIAGKRSVGLWLGVIFISMVGLFLADSYVQSSPHLITDQSILDHFRYRALVGTLALTSIITYLYIGIIDDAIKSASEKEVKIRNLLKIVAHDISTPLMVVGGISKRILNTESSHEDLLSHVKRISNSADRIQKILESVREMEAAHSGKISVELEPVSLKLCIEEAISGFDERLRDKKVKIFVDAELQDDLFVLADYTILTNQVFSNLISNAIKFSRPGEHIVIQSKVEGETCEVKIQDFGIGIPKELQSEIFEMSKSTSRPGTSGEKGTGFGLPLVKMFMLSFQGDIAVASKTKGRTGTTMTLTFAIDQQQKAAA
jgi:signal transduction histidine kinase